MKWSVLPLVALFLLSGCIDATPSIDTSDEGPTEVVVPRPVVVAVIDTGINLYHDDFRRDTPLAPAALATFVNTLDDAAPQNITLTQDSELNHTQRRDADADVWAEMKEETLYHFNGTNVLGISFDDEDDHPVLDDGSHGTGTSAAVFSSDPNVIVVLVEGIGPDAEAWAAEQPWIDIVSMSYGPIGSVPGTGPLLGLTTAEATRLMWETGKVPVGAADNTPALATFDETAGPPWVVGVAGDHPGGCREPLSGNLPDFTSHFTQELPRANSTHEHRRMSGTSFATPMTAGSFGLVLRELREAYGAPPAADANGTLAYDPEGEPVTNSLLRAAFERAARYGETDPSCGHQIVNPVAPWVQQGWGHVDADVAQDALALFTGGSAVPEKSDAARQWNAQAMELRRTYWGDERSAAGA